MVFMDKINKKCLCIIVLFLLGCAYAVWRLVPPRFVNVLGSDSRIGVSFVRQLVTEDSSTSRTIMFAVKEKSKYAVEYKEEGSSGKINRAVAEDVSFEENKEQYLQYTAHIPNLVPNKKYKYRIANGDKSGSWHELNTDDGKNGFTAMIFADAQSGDGYVKWRNVARTAWNNNNKATLYLNLGDQVDNGQVKWYWDGWFDGLDPFGADIPMAALIGNHELYEIEDGKEVEGFATTHIKLFDFPAPVEEYKNQFYSFDFGDVHFVVLDTNYLDENEEYQPHVRSAQLAWLEEDLAKSKAKFKVALMHRDILLYEYIDEFKWDSTHGTFILGYGTDFMPIFDQYGVDAVFSGHLHTYRRRGPIKAFEPSEEGPIYIMLGAVGTQDDYARRWKSYEWDVKASPEKPEKGSYMTMQVMGNRMTLKAFMTDGKQFDEVVIDKK